MEPITSTDECNQAAAAIGMERTNAQKLIRTGTPRPEGCYTQNGFLYIAINPDNIGNGVDSDCRCPICKGDEEETDAPEEGRRRRKKDESDAPEEESGDEGESRRRKKEESVSTSDDEGESRRRKKEESDSTSDDEGESRRRKKDESDL